MLCKINVVDNDTEYRGLFESDSIGHMIDLVWEKLEFDNCKEFWRTPVVSKGKEHLCGYINPDYYSPSDLPSPCSFDDVEAIANGSGGVAIYAKEAKGPNLNVLISSED
jgi:hypothetical protein